MSLRPLFQTLALTACLGSSLITPLVWAENAAEPSAEKPTGTDAPGKSDAPLEKPIGLLPLEDLRTFTKVYEHIRQAYVHEIDDKTLLEYAIKGMLSELDPHSTYLNAESFEDLQVNTTGEFGGLGIEVGMEDGFVKVISPIDDTPASRAGIEAGDLIVKLDDKAVKGMSLDDAVKMMRGPKGSQITLTIVRKGIDKPLEIVLTRDTISVQSVRSQLLDDHYGYLRVAQFQVNTGKDLVKEINRLKKKTTLQGVILDLRNNPGGVLQAAVDVADAFLEEGLIVYTEGRIENADLRYLADPGDETDGLPLIVLINDGSASASEIVAGALQDHRRALIVGTDSFGKGSVQTVIPITQDKAIKLTTALYFTPSGRSIQAQGIVPDITIERAKLTSLANGNILKEADLVGHLNNGNGGKDRTSKALKEQTQSEDGDNSLFNRDNQLFEALNLLKGLHFFQQSANLQPADTTTGE